MDSTQYDQQSQVPPQTETPEPGEPAATGGINPEPDLAPGAEGVTIEERVKRLEEFTGLNRVYVHDVEPDDAA